MSQRLDLAALRAALDAMTPGPWVHGEDGIGFRRMVYIPIDGDPTPQGSNFFQPYTEADAAGIVAIVNAAPALLDRIAALEAAALRVLETPRGSDEEFEAFVNLRGVLDGEPNDQP